MADNTKTIDVSGAKLEIKWVGPRHTEDSSMRVSLHEGLGCVEMWRKFPQILSERVGLPAVIFSSQGYGKSDPTLLPRPKGFTHNEGLIVLPKVLDAVGITRANLIGHSDGGSISIINASGVQDPRMEAIVLLAAHVFFENVTLNRIEEAKVAFQISDLRNRLAKYHGDNVDCAFWDWNRIWLNPKFQDRNIEEYLPHINVPTLVIQGKEDQYGTEAQVTAIQEGIGNNIQVSIMAECQHSPHFDQQEKTLDRISHFLEGLPPC